MAENKYKIIIGALVVVIALGLGYFFFAKPTPQTQKTPNETPVVSVKEEEQVGLANPAAVYCKQNGGTGKIIKSDKGEYSMCQFADGTECEEWAYYRKECNFEQDATEIFNALKAKGLNLTGMKVVIRKHMGKFAGGSVTPLVEPAGGGYVFAAKVGGNWKIVADGNGIISCEQLLPYPDFPSYLISECIDKNGNPVTRTN